jgi:hypothetical protein
MIMKTLINFLLFQAGWFATVLGAANSLPWLGPVVVLAVVAVHLRFSPRPGPEAVLLSVAILMGLILDSLVLATGWISYPNGVWLNGLAPYWIISLWALFATTLNVSMRWLSGRPWLAALFGGIGGPASYFAGAKLGAMTFVAPIAAILALALAWALAMPLLMYMARQLDQPGKRGLPSFIHDKWSFDSHV